MRSLTVTVGRGTPGPGRRSAHSVHNGHISCAQPGDNTVETVDELWTSSGRAVDELWMNRRSKLWMTCGKAVDNLWTSCGRTVDEQRHPQAAESYPEVTHTLSTAGVPL